MHTTKEFIKCIECGICFGLREDLDEHTRCRPCGTAWKCAHCNLSYLDKEFLVKHIHTDHPIDSIYKCDICHTVFAVESELRKHAIVHANENVVGVGQSDLPKGGLNDSLACLNCSTTFLDVESLKKHLLDHKTSEKASNSDTSGELYQSSSCLQKHKPDEDNACYIAVTQKNEKELPNYGPITDAACSNIATSSNAARSDQTGNRSIHSDHTLSDASSTSNESSLDVDLTKQTFSDHCPGKMYNCQLCGATYATQSMLHDHTLVHEANKSNKCPHCGAMFRIKEQFEEHLRIHFSEAAYACLDCRINFTNINNLNDHLRIHHSLDKSQSCEVGEASRRPLAPVRVKPHKCEECTASFISKRELWEHVSVHSNDMTYTCQECGIAFAELLHLTDHIRSQHRVEQEYNNCEFNTRALSHLGRPGVLMPYQCVHCGSEFLSESELVVHVRIHTSEMTYACQDCSLVFADATGLNKHILSRHPGDKERGSKVGHNFRTGNTGNVGATLPDNPARPFKCDVCGSDFSRKTHLIRHALIHTGAKPFKCEQCGKAFGRKSHLQRHAFIHTGEKPFICDHCGMAFGRRSHLKRHSLRQHGETMSDAPAVLLKSETSPVHSELPTCSSQAVAFPGMQPRSAKPSSPTPVYPPVSQVKQEVESNMFHSPTPLPFSSDVKSPVDPSQLSQARPYWNLFQPMLSFNINEAMNWSRQSDAHSAYPNLKHNQKPLT